MKISQALQKKLICPSTKGKLQKNDDYFDSILDPSIRYPVIDGIPILIDKKKSIFSIEDFTKRRNTTFNLKPKKIRKALNKLIPGITLNIKARKNYEKLVAILHAGSKILVIGGSIAGEGMDVLYSNDSLEIIGSDVSFGPFTKMISDAHDIPFEDDVFDCVIIQAVLEHVLNPHRCVQEVHRVLKSTGMVYAETPFMQQVHMKQFDFTRFTHLGHRRLFRYFEEVDSGPCCGPGMALASSYTSFLRSFTSSRWKLLMLTAFGYTSSFFLKYFDYFLIDKPGSYDAASGYFFMGRKKDIALSDRELIMQFKGLR